MHLSYRFGTVFLISMGCGIACGPGLSDADFADGGWLGAEADDWGGDAELDAELNSLESVASALRLADDDCVRVNSTPPGLWGTPRARWPAEYRLAFHFDECPTEKGFLKSGTRMVHVIRVADSGEKLLSVNKHITRTFADGSERTENSKLEVEVNWEKARELRQRLVSGRTERKAKDASGKLLMHRIVHRDGVLHVDHVDPETRRTLRRVTSGHITRNVVSKRRVVDVVKDSVVREFYPGACCHPIGGSVSRTVTRHERNEQKVIERDFTFDADVCGLLHFADGSERQRRACGGALERY